MKVLVVAPHPDDEAIGCGGAIIGHGQAGDRLEVVFLTSGENSHPDRPPEEVRDTRESEARAAAAILGVEDVDFLRLPDYGLAETDRLTDALDQVLARVGPDVIYTPHGAEWHPDHRAAFESTVQLAKARGLDLSSVLAYEVWTPLEHYDEVIDISEHMERKLEAIRCYRSQLATFDYLRAATGLGQYRGALAARTGFAEVFRQAEADEGD